MPLISGDVWVISSGIEQQIKAKIEAIGTPLKDWNLNINRGIVTGFNDAFIIDTETKERLCLADPKSTEVIKPVLRGCDIKRYEAKWAELWVIATFPALHLNIDDYPAVRDFLRTFGKRLEQTGEDGCRKKTCNQWFEIQDTVAYYKEFEEEKIAWGNLALNPQYSLIAKGVHINAPCPLITPANKYVLAVLNSPVSDYYIRKLGVTRNGGYFEYKPMFIEQLPIPKIPESEQQPFIKLVDEILADKKAGNDTSALEREIDVLVYGLYGLSDEEIAIVEGGK